MAEKVVSALFGQIAAMSLIVTPTSVTLAEVDVGTVPQRDSGQPSSSGAHR